MESLDQAVHEHFNRRGFVKSFVQVAAFYGLCAPVSRLLVAEIQAQTTNFPGGFRCDLAVSPFTALQQLNGSVRVKVPHASNLTELTAFNNPTPSVIITRVATSGTSQFGCVSQRCTHAQEAVSPKASGQNFLFCPSHGSTYNIATGAVINGAGGPNQGSLTSYTSTFTAAPSPGILLIQFATVGFTTVTALVASTQTTSGKRVRLMFPSRTGSTYEVRFRPSLSGTETLLPLFTTANGTGLGQNTIAGTTANGGMLTVFVNPPADVGIYSILAR